MPRKKKKPIKKKPTRKKLEPTINWKKRCWKDETDCAYRRTWDDWDGKYRVQEAVSKFTDYPTYYFALYFSKNNIFEIISKHKKRSLAEQACEHYKLMFGSSGD